MSGKPIVSLVLSLLLLLSVAPGHAWASETERLSQMQPYRMEVDLTHQLVFVYANEDDSIVRTMICSTGKKDGTTPMGTFYLPPLGQKTERGQWHLLQGNSYGRYATRIVGSILFHSIPYKKRDVHTMITSSWNNLGSRASLGCVRLTPLDAQWVAYNCLAYTRVDIVKPSEDKTRRALNKALKQDLPPAQKDGSVGAWEPTLLKVKSTLAIGSAGEEVRSLQLRLRQLGFFEGRMDGNYTANTIAAVERFERAVGAKRTGIATAELQDLIQKETAPTGQFVKLKQGDTGPSVRAMQDRLIQMELLGGEADGFYGPKTQAAVEGFYQTLYLPAEEEASSIMQVMLFEMTGGAPSAPPAQSESDAHQMEQVDGQ